MIELVKSPVVFCEDTHTYRLDDKRLSGITSLIHEILNLGTYPEASDYVKNYAIPRAADYGSKVHKSIQVYDELGLRFTHYEGGKFGVVDTELELDAYIKNREGYTPIANEYTVSDNKAWASQIDNVWQNNLTQGIWLADTKTNNLDYYPGGEEALKEYLSWQLSIYAELFERQNPTLKVEGLCCNWLRKGQSAFWVIKRLPKEKVDLLLATNYIIDNFGRFHYFNKDIAPTLPVAPNEEKQLIPKHLIQCIAQIQKEYDMVTAIRNEMLAKLREAMENNDVKSWENDLFKATIAKDSVSNTFNSTLFKKENPELYKKYCEWKVKKGGFTIKLKKNESK